MSTAPRQRVRAAQGEEIDISSNHQTTSPHTRRHFTRRKRQKQSFLIWELTGAFLLLLLLFFGAPSSHDGRQSVNNETNNEKPVQQEKIPPSIPDTETETTSSRRPILTAFLEPPDTLQTHVKPLPPRTTSAERLTKIEYPQVQQCSTLFETFPINDYPKGDPFLPWIHDVFATADGTFVKFVAQNKRRCDTGTDQKDTMKYWEPQISLFQPVPIQKLEQGTNNRFRLASSPDDAFVKETRFQCRFHSFGIKEETTFSEYPFNYEYVNWRKRPGGSMFSKTDKDMDKFWLSQLYFSCPVPEVFQEKIKNQENDVAEIFLDLVPIRTPARDGQFLFTEQHVGTENMGGSTIFDAATEWGSSHVLPDVKDSGRWANIPVCLPPSPQTQHHLVACTWTSSSYTRRGDAVTLDDTATRLREWIVFHSLVGFDQLYVYDNSILTEKESPSELEQIANEFPDLVTYHRWPCQVCNNNRPGHKNPGERSSQYAAEASCRERYGPSTEWMAFIDTDEYLVPMKGDNWTHVLQDMDKQGMKILKMRSSRAKPRVELMEPLEDQSQCVEKKGLRKRNGEPDPCVVPRKDQTFLRVYNCEYIRPPRPERFARAMKQMYKPDHVLSHFVHYSTITRDIARLRKDYSSGEKFIRSVQSKQWQAQSPEVFLDELKEGTLIHSRSVLPTETTRRTSECFRNSKSACMMGFPCPDTTEFVDADHQKNVFRDDKGKYCNCWVNKRVEEFFVPKLESALKEKAVVKP